MSNFESFSEDLIPRILPKPILVPVLVNDNKQFALLIIRQMFVNG